MPATTLLKNRPSKAVWLIIAIVVGIAIFWFRNETDKPSMEIKAQWNAQAEAQNAMLKAKLSK